MLSERWFSWHHLVRVLIAVSDQAYHRCVISKFDDDVGAVCGCTVMCAQGVQEWAEDAALRNKCLCTLGSILNVFKSRHKLDHLFSWMPLRNYSLKTTWNQIGPYLYLCTYFSFFCWWFFISKKNTFQNLITCCLSNAFFPVTSSEKPSMNQIYYCSLSKILTVISAIIDLLKKSVLNQPKVACWS